MRTVRGFTLLEILVALTLFAVVGGTLLQLFQSGLRTARLAGDRTHAVLLARSKLVELQAYTHLEAGTLSGTFDDDYHWQAVLSPLPDLESGEPRLLQALDLNLTVTWGEGGDQRSFTLHSLLLSQQVAS